MGFLGKIFGSESIESLLNDLKKAVEDMMEAVSKSSAPPKTKLEIIDKIREETLDAIDLYTKQLNVPETRGMPNKVQKTKSFSYMLQTIIDESDFESEINRDLGVTKWFFELSEKEQKAIRAIYSRASSIASKLFRKLEENAAA